jgi:acyl-coenzyme A synthetase/AMP-(fatty) acid ligase
MTHDVPVFPDYPPTLPNVLADCVARYAEHEFLVEGERRLTYRDAERETSALARGLLALGVGKAARVGVLMPNCADWVLAWLAAARIGAFTVPLSTFFQAREISWALNEADIDTLLVCSSFLSADYLERLERAVPELADQSSPQLFLASHPYLRRIVVWGPCDRRWAMKGPEALREAGQGVDEALVAGVEALVSPADWLIGICTSGSTAHPKIVVHAHGGFVRITHAFRPYLLGARPGDRNYCGQPLFWLGGLNTNLMPVMYEGACMVFAPTPRVEDVFETVIREQATRISLWGTEFKPLFELGDSRGVDLRPLAMYDFDPRDAAGRPIPPERRMVSLMGMTETFGPHGVGRWEEILPEKNGMSWGRALQGIERKVVDPASGRTLPPGEAGELQVRGFSLMQGYYKRERDEVFEPDGFFATGDTASLDEDGYVYFKGRLSEMIKTAGANVSPQEVETLMGGYEGVAEAIVFGLPDEARGQCVAAVVVPRQGAVIDVEALLRRLRADISSYKVPKKVFVLDYGEVPRTSTGKARKIDLQRMIEERG